MFRRILVILISLLVPLSIAGVAYAQQLETGGKTVVLPKDETVNKDYFAAGETVTLAGTINGDAYLAGGTVNIEGRVNGDLIAVGGIVNVRGKVENDVRIGAGQIIISGEIGGNATTGAGSVSITDSAKVNGSLVSGSGNLSIFAPIGKGLTIGAGNSTIGSEVTGDITAGVGQLTFTPNAKVSGNVTYWSDVDAQIQPGAQILGKIVHNFPPKPDKEKAAKAMGTFALAVKVISFISALIIGFLLIKFLPIFTQRTANTISKNALKSLGMGILALILTPIIAVILLVTIVGIPLAFILLVAFAIELYLAKIFVSLVIGQKILKFLGQKAGNGWSLVLGLIVFMIVTMVPIIGWIVALIVLLLGLGAIVLQKRETFLQISNKKLI